MVNHLKVKLRLDVTDSSKTSCKSCDAEQTGKYCSACGEVKLTPELRTVTHILRDLVKELTDLDSKLWLTLRTLLSNPGKVDYDYSVGRRRIYIKPITLFLLINICYMMFASLSDFYVNFFSQRDLQVYSGWIKPYLIEYIANSGLSEAEFVSRYDQLVKALARSLIIIQVPFFALFITALCYKKELFSGDYFIFSLNFHSCVLILFIVAGYPDYLIYWINDSKILPFNLPYTQWLFLFGGKLLYILFALKMMFKFTWLQTLWRLPIVIVLYGISHMIYRFIQLLITISLMDYT